MNTQEDIGWRVERGWELLRERRYEECSALWRGLLTLQGYEHFYREQGEKCLLAGDWKGAVESFLQMHPARPDIRAFPSGVDVALWLGGLGEAACWDWSRSISWAQTSGTICSPTGSSALLLWWASAHREYRSWRETAVNEIKRMRAGLRSREPGFNWFLCDVLMGFLPKKTLLSITTLHDAPGYRQDERFYAWFYIGAIRLSCGDTRGYYECMRRAIEVGLSYQIFVRPEYYLALQASRYDPNQLTLEGLGPA